MSKIENRKSKIENRKSKIENRKSKIGRGDTPRASVPPPGFLSPRRGVCRWWSAHRPAKGGPAMVPATGHRPQRSMDSVIRYASFY